MAIKRKFSGSAPMKGKKSGNIVSSKGTGRPAPSSGPVSSGPAGPGMGMGMSPGAGAAMKKGGIVKKKKK